MSDNDTSGSRELLPRIGAPWTDADHAALVEGLRAGLTDEELSTQLGRTINGIRKRAKMLLSPEHSNATGRAAMDLLRQQVVEDEDSDWIANVRDSTRREGRRYWTADDDAKLTEAWETTVPLSKVAEQFNTSEQLVVRQIIALGLTSTTIDVTDRLGCTPGGVVDMQRRIAVDDESAQVWVLVVNGLPGPQSVQVSLHATEAEATYWRDRALNENTITSATNPWWCISRRTVGRGNLGALTFGYSTP